MNWLAKAKAHFSEMAPTPTDKTDERGVSAVSSVPTGRIYEFPQGVSAVSSVGVTAIFENCISVEELIEAAMRACDHHNDSAAARLPGASRCRPGAELWRAYLAALPPPVQYDTDKRRAARRTALEISRRIP